MLKKKMLVRFIVFVLSLVIGVGLYSGRGGKVNAVAKYTTVKTSDFAKNPSSTNYEYADGVLTLKGSYVNLELTEDFSCSKISANGINLRITGDHTLTVDKYIQSDYLDVKAKEVKVTDGYISCNYLYNSNPGSKITINAENNFINDYALSAVIADSKCDIDITSSKGGMRICKGKTIHASGSVKFENSEITIKSVDSCIYTDTRASDDLKFYLCKLDLESSNGYGIYDEIYDTENANYNGEPTLSNTDCRIKSKESCIFSYGMLSISTGNIILESEAGYPFYTEERASLHEIYLKASGAKAAYAGNKIIFNTNASWLDEPVDGKVDTHTILDASGNEAKEFVIGRSYGEVSNKTVYASQINTKSLCLLWDVELIMDVPLTVNRVFGKLNRNLTITGSYPLTVTDYMRVDGLGLNQDSDVTIQNGYLFSSSDVTIGDGASLSIYNNNSPYTYDSNSAINECFKVDGKFTSNGNINIDSDGYGINVKDAISFNDGSCNVKSAEYAVYSYTGINIDNSLKIKTPKNGSVFQGDIEKFIVDEAGNAANEVVIKNAEVVAQEEKAEQEAKEKAEREAKEKAEQEAKEKAEQEAKEKAEQEAKEKAEQEAKEKAEQEAKEKAEQEAKEKAEQEAKEKAEQEAKEKAGKKKTQYHNEWNDGKWYNSEGFCDYEGTLSWKSDAKGWWVEDTKGWYPKSQWVKIDGKWYYFLADGYMDYSEYRDGCWLGADGAWVEEYYGGTWKSDGKGWWYEDASGWYPVSQWVWIDGSCYYFESTGYIAVNKYVDGCWLGADGAWVK